MTDTELKYFEALRAHNQRQLEFLLDPQFSGVKQLISNLYRDDAHFVYELLQNADDQGATYAKFLLENDRLIFIHNAPKHFTISNRETHAEDQRHGCLGDVNAILSIGSSSKTGRTEEVQIGKFGLGFKSVFVYTDCPKIYDPNIRFMISDFIVPSLIENDHPLRDTDQTLFEFVFKPGLETKAFAEISDRLNHLVNPLLFLNHLKKIEWETAEASGHYRLHHIEDKAGGARMLYEVSKNDDVRQSELWKFEREVEIRTPTDSGEQVKMLPVSVVFTVTDGKIDTSRSHPLYCYLPTANDTYLPAILHAPFRLTGNRESIVAKDLHNIRMVAELAALLAESLEKICIVGEQEHTPWIDDNILDFVRRDNRQNTESTTVQLDISPIRYKVLNAIREKSLLWCQQLSRYVSTGMAIVAENEYLPDLYPSELLSRILNEPRGWVLPTIKLRSERDLVKQLNIEIATPDKILRKINDVVLAEMSVDWLKGWYKKLLEVPNAWRKSRILNNDPYLRYRKIILTSSPGLFAAPFTINGKEETPNVHLNQPDAAKMAVDGLTMVDDALCADDEVMNFLSALGLRVVDDFTMAESVYLPMVSDEALSFDDRINAFVKYVEIFTNKLNKEQQDKLKTELHHLPAYDPSTGWGFYAIDKVKLHNGTNDFFFRGNDEVVFFEPKMLGDILSPEEAESVYRFIRDFYPCSKSPIVSYYRLGIDREQEKRLPKLTQRPADYNKFKVTHEYVDEPLIQGLEHFVKNVAPNHPREASDVIVSLIYPNFLFARYRSFYSCWQPQVSIEPLYYRLLREAQWIELASIELRKILGLEVKEMGQTEMDQIKSVLATSGIVSKEDVDGFLAFIKDEDILKRYQLKQSIEEQKAAVKASTQCSLGWLDQILELRLRYVAANEKEDIAFLIQALKQAINSLKQATDTDLRELLPDGLNIIFGPPGTGKTTEITRIVQGMKGENPDCRILILAPTNAAAKVVAERLNLMGIVAHRGINPNNEELYLELESLGIPVYDATVDPTPSIVASTVHYYSRTFASKEGKYLHDMAWDAIIVDESSMVTLDYMLLAIFKGREANPQCRFYIVGDPLQLPAITNLDPFILEEAQLDEFNFYSFIGLSEFSDQPSGIPENIRRRLNIHLLKKQYRSVKPLCELTSKFAYNDSMDSAFNGEPLNLPATVLPIFDAPLSFVRFPVTSSGLEPQITDIDKLKGSNFNIYSALLVKEALQHLFGRLKESGYDRDLSVGVITPYAAQKKLIEKLLNANPISRGTNVQVFVNTVHQFQGDEFDIVMLVLNPPNQSMRPVDNIMINRHYLINVATSRAKNCLVVMYPDAETCAVGNFIHINKGSAVTNIESIAEGIFGCDVSELTFTSADIERRMFGAADYLSTQCELMMHEEVNYHEPLAGRPYRFVKGGASIDIIHNPLTLGWE